MNLKFSHLGLLFLSIFCISAETDELLGDTDGAWNYFGYNGYAGEVTINALTGSSYFYWLFEAIKGNIFTDKLPIIIWLEGGPGCSSEFGMFYDNIGPFNINSNMQPQNNPYTWTNDFHVMSIDFPLGAGFSYANAGYDMKNTTTTATAQLYNLLIKLNQKYPTWFNRDLYIFGESYAGHWIPGIAYKILSENRSPNAPFRFQLKGVGMGDPWVDPLTQSQTYSNFGFQTGLINQAEQIIVKEYEQKVITDLNNGQLAQALIDSDKSYNLIAGYAGGISVYNIRDYSGGPDLGTFPAWLNLASTKTMLNVPQKLTWVSCSDVVNDAMPVDVMTSFISYVPYLIENIKVLIYNGQDDLIVNTIGTEAMIAAMNWPYVQNFINSNKIIWKTNGQVSGYVQTYDNLAFISVIAAGHMVIHDQPINGRDMVYRFINNQGWQ